MRKVLNKSNAGLLVVFSAFALSACGGGGSGGDDGPTASKLTPGVFDIGRANPDGTADEGISLLSPTGKFVATFVKNNYSFGDINFSASGEISGPVAQYRVGSPTWEITKGSLSGQVDSSKMAALTASSADNPDLDSVLYRRQGPSDSGVTLEDINATFTVPDNTLEVTIGADGTVDGNDGSGCILRGKITIPDTTINVFEVAYKADGGGCADTHKNSDFSGLGTYNHADDPSDGELTFYARNDEVAWLFKGKR